MLTNSLKLQVIQRVGVLIDIAEQKYGQSFRMPSISYRLRGSTAGRADLNTWHVDFNPTLLVDHTDEYLEHTVGHEVAHFVCTQKDGMQQFHHGQRWQRVMRDFKLPIRITSTYHMHERPVRRRR